MHRVLASGSIEVGHINYSPRIQRTIPATEAMYLIMRRAFQLAGLAERADRDDSR
jgi:hypothetical protein